MRRTVLAVLVVVLFLASCAGSGSSASTDPVDGADGPSGSSPLEAELGFASEPGRRRYLLAQAQRAANAELVGCMEGQGYFYATAPIVSSLSGGATTGDGTREWAAANGLGITAAFDEALAATVASAESAEVANADYVASLGTEDALFYDRALVGLPEAQAVGVGIEYEPGGCWGAALGELVVTLRYVDAFGAELDALNSRLGSDPRTMKFHETWSICMHEAGYQFANPSALADEIYAQLLSVELVETETGPDVSAPEVLESIEMFERQVAVASHDCHRPFRDQLEALRHDYEREFLSDQRFRIAELAPQG